MATLHPRRLPKPPPYDFNGEADRKRQHDIRFATAKDNNGNQPTCPYCYMPSRVIQRHLYCGCKT